MDDPRNTLTGNIYIQKKKRTENSPLTYIRSMKILIQNEKSPQENCANKTLQTYISTPKLSCRIPARQYTYYTKYQHEIEQRINLCAK